MKRVLLLSGVSFAFAAAFLGSANAADMSMPLKAPAYSPPPSNWTGFYIGINGGAGWGTAASSIDLAGLGALVGGVGVTGSIPVGSHEINGFLGGGQIGYNWQSGNIVFGVEGDGDWADIEGTAPCITVLSCSAKVNWTADATARLGVLPMSNMLIYVKGGAAWAGLDYNLSSSGALGAGTSLTSSLSTTKTGGMLGLGTEYLFAPHWTAKIEYNYADFGSHTDSFVLTATGVGSVAVPVSTTLQMHTVKAGINYHF